MADCAHGEVPAEHTNAGLAQAWKNERDALNVCNADKKALRTWADSTATAVQPK